MTDKDVDSNFDSKLSEDEFDRLEDIDHFERLTQDQIKKKLRQLGMMLKTKVKQITSKYSKDTVSFGTIVKISKKINKREARLGKYLSWVIRNEDVYRRYMATMLIKSNFHNKLDQFVASWLQQYDPTISELASRQQAQLLASSLSRIYENNYKTLYGVTRQLQSERISDKDIMICILETVQYCYTTCKSTFWKQTLNILHYISQVDIYTITNCPHTICLRIKELMKHAASYTLPFLQQAIRRGIIREQKVRLLLRVHNTQKPPLRTFLDLCTETIWYMLIQDPPLVLDFTQDKTLINHTSNDMIGQQTDYIVWPCVLSHEDGDILIHGVVESATSSKNNSPVW
ncbi:hypothetical protein ACF0H5_011022 [Mactra antiquata]